MSTASHLAAHLDSFRNVRVLCVGDVMLDRFVYGDVSRVSPEAPIPVCRVRHETAMLGGAGNVARNLVALGADVVLVSVAGDDATRAEIEGLLGELDGVQAELLADGNRATTVKTRFIAGGQQLLRADQEDTAPISGALEEDLGKSVERLMPQVGAIVLSDYGKGVLTERVVARLIAAARDAGTPVLVDPKGHDYTIYRGAGMVTPNRKELHDAARMPTDTDEAIVAAARHIASGCGIEAVLVTRGGDGMTLVAADDVSHLPAEAREVFDVSGAGDTVIAVMAAARAAGMADTDAARLANVAAGIVVAKAGTAVAPVDDVRAALRVSDLHGAEGKIVSVAAALQQLADWRARDQRIGFTNGVFDLLHPGHISLLSQARAACDRLIVGLNSDSSVQRLKGPDRPVQSEASRAAVLASLANVDLVIIFSEETPIELIEALRPDVLVKGADYTVETVVGASIVESYGGRVLLADLKPGHSTTGTIAKLAR